MVDNQLIFEGRPCAAYDVVEQKLIAKFKSRKEAAKYFNVRYHRVVEAIRKKTKCRINGMRIAFRNCTLDEE